MKSNRKTKIIILISFGILIALLPIFVNNLGFTARDRNITSNYKFDHENLKISAVSGKIHIDGNSGWAAFKAAGNCTGNGTYSDPYVIEDLVIDGGGGSEGSCILIENSDVFFRIENCTLFNSGRNSYNAGIRLYNITNAQLNDNDCSSNAEGIYLNECNNSTVSGNVINNNYNGIYLDDSYNNTIVLNNANGNEYNGVTVIFCNDSFVLGNIINGDGIFLSRSNGITLLGNNMNSCGLKLYGFTIEEMDSHNIDTTNLVNGKPLYYYSNEVNLGSNDFTNAGQVILVNCSESLISNLNVSQTSRGISLHFCHYNEISNNIANKNLINGIRLYSSDNNIISGNTASNCIGDDAIGIELHSSNSNKISDNTANNHLGVFGTGIMIWEGSEYNLVSGNTATNNWYGIFSARSDHNTFSENTANNNSRYGIYIYWSDVNAIADNIANENDRGIYLHAFSSNNTVLANTVNNNDYGISLFASTLSNTILRNIVNYNDYGISIRLDSNNNTITENSINDNSLVGIFLDNCLGNIIYLNCFNNTLNAIDEGSDNQWDNGIKGNYWADYDATDAPYNITGSAGSQDNFPLMKCPISAQDGGRILGYNLFLLIGILSVVAILISNIVKKSKNLI